jgi:hypothetical protein
MEPTLQSLRMIANRIEQPILIFQRRPALEFAVQRVAGAVG